MSVKLKAIITIENLNVEDLALSLEHNGHPEASNVIRQNKINGEQFFRLQESNIRSWKLNPIKSILFHSFLLRIKEHPEEFLVKQKNLIASSCEETTKQTDRLPPGKRAQKPNHITVSNKYKQPHNASHQLQNCPDKKIESTTQLKPPVLLKPKYAKPTPQQLIKNDNIIEPHSIMTTKKDNNIINADEDECGYLLPTDVEVSEENYEPAPILKEDTKTTASSYKYIKMKLQQSSFQSRYNIQKLKERPLPPLPDEINVAHNETAKNKQPEEDLADYIDIDNNNKQSTIQKQPTTNANISNLHILLNKELKKRDFVKTSNLSLPMPPKLPTPPKKILVSHPNDLNEYKNSSRKKSCSEQSPSNIRREGSAKTLNDLINDLQNNTFYRDTNRKGAKLLLKDLADGAFLIRPPNKSNFFAIIVVKKGEKFFNIGIERTLNLTLKINSVGETPTFNKLSEIIDHFSNEPLLVVDGVLTNKVEVYLKQILPP